MILAGVAIAAVYVFSRSAAVESIYPVQKACHFIKENVFSRISGAWRGSAAAAENERLKRDVASLAVLVDEVARLEAENSRLRSLLDYKAGSRATYTAAAVLSRGGGAVESGEVVRIDKGASSGIRVNAVVVTPEGLVGKVVSVTRHTAEVMLLTDPRLKVSCVVEQPGNRLLGILAGGFKDSLSLKYVANISKPVVPGSRVVTSGLGGIFPEGYVVGDSIGGNFVRPRVDFSSLEDVLVRNEE